MPEVRGKKNKMKVFINKIIVAAAFVLCMAIGAVAQNDPKKPAPPKPKPPVIKPKPKPSPPKPESSEALFGTQLAIVKARY